MIMFIKRFLFFRYLLLQEQVNTMWKERERENESLYTTMSIVKHGNNVENTL